jgi:hypothetical protein
MDTQTSDLQVVMERLEKAEKQTRWLRAWSLATGTVSLVIALLAVVLFISLLRSCQPYEPVEAPETEEEKELLTLGWVLKAKGFELADEAGKTRAALFLDEKGAPRLEFYDEQGNVIWQAQPAE